MKKIEDPFFLSRIGCSSDKTISGYSPFKDLIRDVIKTSPMAYCPDKDLILILTMGQV
jgi:hypothetical protein